METKNQIKEGNIVDVDFRNSKYLRGVKIVEIKKGEAGKIYCDLEIPVGFEEQTTIIKEIDSDFIKLSDPA
jgi:hypothetical protein